MLACCVCVTSFDRRLVHDKKAATTKLAESLKQQKIRERKIGQKKKKI